MSSKIYKIVKAILINLHKHCLVFLISFKSEINYNGGFERSYRMRITVHVCYIHMYITTTGFFSHTSSCTQVDLEICNGPS